MMSTYNIHAGHGPAGGTGCGAAGLLNESVEDRKVKNRLIELLRNAGHTVYDCTCEENKSAGSILTSIVQKCNSHPVDLDISIHLNSGRGDSTGDGKTGGVEVYGYNIDAKYTGDRICSDISTALGISNRGFKIDKNLYVLNSTHSPAILIECCFVDDKDDADRWDAGKCAEAIYTALTGRAAASSPAANSKAKEQARVQLYSVNGTAAQRWKVHHNSDGTISLENVACGLFLDVEGGKADNGTTVQAYKKGKGKNQKWKLEQMDGNYAPFFTKPVMLVSALNKSKCLDVSGGGKLDGTKIDIYEKNKTKAQQWAILDHGDGTWTIINIGSCKALDVSGGGK